MGLECRESLLERLEATNLLETFPGHAAGKGDHFPRRRARRCAKKMCGSLRGRTVLLAGKRVAEAFGVVTDYLTWHDHPEGFRAVVIPHPSGVNRWWNDPENRRRFLRFARAVLEDDAGCQTDNALGGAS